MFGNLPQVLNYLLQAARRSEGQTMAEYGIMVAAIAVIVIVAAAVFGSSVSNLFNANAAKV